MACTELCIATNRDLRGNAAHLQHLFSPLDMRCRRACAARDGTCIADGSPLLHLGQRRSAIDGFTTAHAAADRTALRAGVPSQSLREATPSQEELTSTTGGIDGSERLAR
jgi:hypothetical protein